MLFSQRMGLKPVGKLVQRESIDEDLRNKIWNVLKLEIWDHWEPVLDAYSMHSRSGHAKKIDGLLQVLWFYYFKKPLDTQPSFDRANRGNSFYEVLTTIVLKGEWHEVFDLVELIAQYMPKESPRVTIVVASIEPRTLGRR
jgi:AbiJ N-terminal domain 4